MTTATTVRFDEKDKAEATSLLASMGLTLNAYLALSVKQLLNQRRIPFDIVPPNPVPNEQTRRAIVAAAAEETGLIADDARKFEDVDKAMDWLNEE